MMRNDYRRALILLRSNAPGYSGHVRLERRTLMGSMYFMVQTPDCGETLQALLVRRGKDSYDACKLGELSRDSRGQAVLSYNFDPRDICGWELEDYQLITIAYSTGDDCRIVLYGNVDGHAELNWERVMQVVCMSLNAPENPPAPSLPPYRPPIGLPVPPPPMPPEPPIDIPANPDTPDLPTPELPPIDIPANPDTPDLPTPALPPIDIPANPDTPDLPTPALPPPPQPRVASAEAAWAQSPERTAGEELGIDMDLPWPDAVESLRPLFRVHPPLADAPDAAFVYVPAELPEGSPTERMAAGIRVRDGVPVAVRYAIPSVYTPEPPAGLEQYSWAGDGNRGWWVIEAEL